MLAERAFVAFNQGLLRRALQYYNMDLSCMTAILVFAVCCQLFIACSHLQSRMSLLHLLSLILVCCFDVCASFAHTNPPL